MRAACQLLLCLLGIGSSTACIVGGKKEAISCLGTYFNTTGQRIDPKLQELILLHTGAEETEGGGEGSHKYQEYEYEYDMDSQERPGLKQEWCGPFHDFQKCLLAARTACRQVQLYECILKSAFAKTYGKSICNVNTTNWVKPDIVSDCKAIMNGNSGNTQQTSWLILVQLTALVMWCHLYT